MQTCRNENYNAWDGKCTIWGNASDVADENVNVLSDLQLETIQKQTQKDKRLKK